MNRMHHEFPVRLVSARATAEPRYPCSRHRKSPPFADRPGGSRISRNSAAHHKTPKAGRSSQPMGVNFATVAGIFT
jgi:hypothetical protein